MKKSYLEAISRSTVFLGIEPEEREALICDQKFPISEFEKDEVILSPDAKAEKMGIIVSGECTVSRPRGGGGTVHLNTLSVGDCFGILAALSPSSEYPTYVIARKKTAVLFISADELDKLIEASPKIAKNLISFMATRIAFLNEKIATFSSDTVLQKLSRYILALRTGDVCEISFNKNKAARAINAGRASLYRALDSLSAEGIITYDSKKIYITDLNGLERIAQ